MGLQLWRVWPIILPFTVVLSADNLAVLSPFIDEIIAGGGPPYELDKAYDYRAAALSGLEKRMQEKGIWPAAPSAR